MEQLRSHVVTFPALKSEVTVNATVRAILFWMLTIILAVFLWKMASTTEAALAAPNVSPPLTKVKTTFS